MTNVERSFFDGFLKAASLTNSVSQSAPNINSWTNNFNTKAFVEKAIRPAEGNANYGVLTHYLHTTPEQASINTVNHALRDYEHIGGGTESNFIKFLGPRYAPTIGATNDPHHLNTNWIPNVTKFWNQYNRTNSVIK